MKFNRNLKQLLLIMVLSAVAIACSDPPDNPQVISPTNEESIDGDSNMPSQPIALEGIWNLVSLDNQPILSESEITAEFAEGRVNGSAGCNSYFADYQLDNTQLNIETIGSTKRACPDDLMKQESTYLSLLDRAESAAVVDNVLTINTPDGDLVFETAGDSVGNNQ